VDKSASLVGDAFPRRSTSSLDASMKHRTVHFSALGVASLCVGALASALSSAAPLRCEAKSVVAGPCFTVHGRLRLYNGTPSIRIWPAGTTRLLGVTDAQFANFENPALPPPLDTSLDWNTAYIGDYTVCPLAPEKPGTMRTVCVQAIGHLRRLKL
jgi:hypothetical protein